LVLKPGASPSQSYTEKEMNMSNQTTMKSLGEFSRDELNMWRDTQDLEIFQFPGAGVTVAIQDAGNNFADIAVSYQAGDEIKFRKNVGEYLARQRMDHGQSIRVKLHTDNFEYFAAEIANLANLANIAG
jgi:hypothetical protein